MVNLAAPKPVRFLVVLSAAFLIVSALISGVNAYVALASPPLAPYVPTTVGFEGQLTDGSGNPVTNGNYTITFSLYSASSGGTAIWTEAQTVAVSGGLYSVQLGSTTTIPATAFDGARWLGVKVGSDSEMTPRIPISAVPFALNAKNAQGLQGYNVSSSAPSTNNTLYWTGSEWAPRAGTVPDLAAVSSNASPQTFLGNYRFGAALSYIDTANFKVSAGQVMVNGLMRSNSSDTTVGLSSSLDGGSVVSNTTYYVYAVADGSGPGFTITSSTSANSPSGKTNYRKIGWVKTAEDSSNIATIGTNGFNVGNGTLAAITKPRAIVTNTTTETTVYSATIPAGTLTAGNQVNLRLWYNHAQNAASHVYWRVKLGSSTTLTVDKNMGTGSGGYIDIVVIGTGTNTQSITFISLTTTPSTSNDAVSGHSLSGTGSENASNDLTLSVTLQFQVASTGINITPLSGTLMAPYWP